MTKDELARLSALGVATIYEASGRQGLIDMPLIQLLPGSCVAGPARTVLCGQDDNLMVHAVIEQIQPGEVLVLTMPEPAPVALIGELLVTQVKVRGAAGILVDAAVRDAEELMELGLPIWTPSDILVLDADGAVCVKRERVTEVLRASDARLQKEAQLRQRLLAGELSYDLHGLREVVEKERRRQ
jgi:4-hydroxy-4-methyl-2-oxoglutarate aldolase